MAEMWKSKLNNSFPKAEVEALHQSHMEILKQLRKNSQNGQCIDCGEQGTCWAVVNLGIFICVQCADVHRAVGTHISKVKGCTGTYLWGPDEIRRMQEVGNAAAMEYYGAERPPAAASKEQRVEFSRRKYGERPPPVGRPVAAAAAAETARPARAPPAAATAAAPAPRREELPAAATRPAVSTNPFAAAAQAAAPPSVSAKTIAADPWADLLELEAPAKPADCRTTAAAAPLATGGLDDFLGHCLTSPAPAAVPRAVATGPAEDVLWADFGKW